MANLMASHGAVAMDRAVMPALFSRFLARLAALRTERQLRRLDARQRRDAGLAAPGAPHAAVLPGWDLHLQGLR